MKVNRNLNSLMNMSCWNSWIFFNQLRMIDNYDSNACSWFDFLIAFNEIKMRANWKQKTSRMTYQENDTSITSFHCCNVIEANLNALNKLIDFCDCMNDCIQWIIFNYLTYIFNQLQRTASRSWRIQDVASMTCEIIEESDKKREWKAWYRRRTREFFRKEIEKDVQKMNRNIDFIVVDSTFIL